MLVVTGGAGFIGSNLVHGLNAAGHEDILVVDDLSDGARFRNIADAGIMDYLDKDEFLELIRTDSPLLKAIRLIFHQGACSDTTEWDGRYMMRNNYSYSKDLLHYCANRSIPFLYASSAAVYGTGRDFQENPGNEAPVNVYAYSKSLFDHYVRAQRHRLTSQVAGLRYFNVYGPREAHKQSMASVLWHFDRQLQESGELRLFKGNEGYADGEQRRDFIHVDDVVKVNLWLMNTATVAGIYNVGTGQARSFNEAAACVIRWHGRGRIRYIDFPPHLTGSYQSFTEADISGLRQAGYSGTFLTLEQGVERYLDWLHAG